MPWPAAAPDGSSLWPVKGDGDAAVFVLGMIVGAGFAHNFLLASSPKGVGQYGIAATIIGLIVCLGIGFTMRQKA